MRRALCMLLLLLLLPAQAQDKTALSQAYLNSWNGEPLVAAAFDRFVEVEADPDWWSFLMENPGRRSAQFVYLGHTCLEVGRNLGWGEPTDSAALDAWKGKLSIRVKLPAGLSREEKETALDNLALVNSPLGDPNTCLPRGRRLGLEVGFSRQAKKVSGQASADGTQYRLLFPTGSLVTTMPIEEVLKKGR